MPPQLPFERLLHADWSTGPAKRWVAEARRMSGWWQVDAPKRVGDTSAFVSAVFSGASPVLAGFDFPIGLPVLYGRMTGLSDFPSALRVLGKGAWSEFFLVAETPNQVSVRRPFYPRVSNSLAKQANLLAGLGVETMDCLRRECERATTTRRAAGALFWTLGGNQVGKAAIAGWQEVVVPAVQRGAVLWPFDGGLADLSQRGLPVLAETYPAEAYGHVGIQLRAGMSKRRQADRQAAMTGLGVWASTNNVTFRHEATECIEHGFGPSNDGEDAFDALAGLLGMIEVADGRRPQGHGDPSASRQWEGWILGQAPGKDATAFDRECRRQAIIVRNSDEHVDFPEWSDTTGWTVQDDSPQRC
jgi:hypothetical protein